MEQNTGIDYMHYKIGLLKMNGYSDATVARVLGIPENVVHDMFLDILAIQKLLK